MIGIHNNLSRNLRDDHAIAYRNLSFFARDLGATIVTIWPWKTPAAAPGFKAREAFLAFHEILLHSVHIFFNAQRSNM
jgi:hypothetical protein